MYVVRYVPYVTSSCHALSACQKNIRLIILIVVLFALNKYIDMRDNAPC